ncbi:MAG TPA: formate dehydrogenase accessory protein FdhE [Candidatus Binatia bacterium]|nr:formate dehydrogenase accessory protein FdhE [Candidatus Binatia bacterium]
MSGNPPTQLIRWQERIDRLQELKPRYPSLSAVLSLYGETLHFQSDVALTRKQVIRRTVPLREQIDRTVFCSVMPRLLSVAAQSGPDTLRAEAAGLRERGINEWNRLFDLAINEQGLEGAGDFFTRACLQPLAEHLQLQAQKDFHYNGNRCPVCNGLPQMAILRSEGEGASRSLLCSFCLYEWTFRRIACPWCGEENKEKLPRYSAEECAYVHVETCDTCQRYLKAVDLTVNGNAVPLVDEVALTVFDVWANDHGYTKIERNLLGF